MHEEWRRSWPAFAPFIAVDFACTSPPLMPLDAHSFKMRRTPKKNPPENESIFFVFPQPKIILPRFPAFIPLLLTFASHLHHFSEGSRHDYMITGRHIVWKLPKMSHLNFFNVGILRQFWGTQNVNVARVAHNVECDFFCDFQTLWRISLSPISF